MAVELDFSLLFEERLIQPQESLHDRLRGTGVAAFKRAGAEIPHLSGDGKNSVIVCFIFHSTGKNLRLQAEPLQPPPPSCYDGIWEGESWNIAKVLTRYTTSNITLCG